MILDYYDLEPEVTEVEVTTGSFCGDGGKLHEVKVKDEFSQAIPVYREECNLFIKINDKTDTFAGTLKTINIP